MMLGLIPDSPRAGVRAVGNAAGSGAVRALLSRSERADMEAGARDVVKVETATEPRFQELFAPHSPFPMQPQRPRIWLSWWSCRTRSRWAASAVVGDGRAGFETA